MSRVKAVLDGVLRAICVTLFALLVVLVTWQVFTRLVLDNPNVWTEEAAKNVFIWLSLIGISIATGEKADVVMDFLVRKLPVAGQRVTESLAYLATIAFVLVVMVWGGWHQASMAWHQTHPVLPLTAGQLYLAVPVAGVLMGLYLLYHLAKTLTPSWAGIPDIDPEEEVEV
ncbi:TRAP transporter small permease [Puerhibacterium puerhi]|uniref:TRAP transporter small permease n=1 Tax=Puerhibacterium puerhi TaxID=2692623 RepID=UPI00135BE6E5|nr:TRAP transporter small permease [Puerhibacterium puerhi]